MTTATLSTHPDAARKAAGVTTLTFAWRNLWRNARRTWLTAGGIAFALWLLVFARSMNDGTFAATIDLTAQALGGHLQVQHEDFMDEPVLENFLVGADQWLQAAAAHPDVEAVSARVQGFALASAGERSFGAQVVGVDPAMESEWSLLARSVSEGRYLEASNEGYIR